MNLFGVEQQQNNLVNICVISYHNENSKSNLVLFSISITTRTNKTWILEKRYSQFEELDKQLSLYFGESLPQLPKKKLITFFVGKSDEEKEQRRVGLDDYLKKLVVRQEVFNSKPMREFLEIELNQSELLIKIPEMIYQFEGFQYGVRDFVLSKNEGLMFILNSDMNLFTRLDAYLMNMKFPWESENGDQTVVPVGCIECWIKNKEGVYERNWAKLYNSQAICMSWDPVTLSLLVGLDSGSVNYLKVSNIVPKYQRYSESLEIEMHEQRVMGVYLDSNQHLVHSVSKDKRYRVICVDDSKLIADFEPSDYELTHLMVNQDRNKSFVGDRAGSIFIFDISNPKPTPVLQLKTTMKFIRSFAFDPVRNFLLALGFEDGDIYIFDINKEGQEKNAKLATQLKNKAKSRQIVWAQSRGELIIGCADGTVQVWDAKKSQTLYAMKAHEADITKMIWLEKENILMTASKDKSIKVWKFPEFWRNRDTEIQEQEEDQIRMKIMSQIDIQRKYQEDDDEDLQSWHRQDAYEDNDNQNQNELL